MGDTLSFIFGIFREMILVITTGYNLTRTHRQILEQVLQLDSRRTCNIKSNAYLLLFIIFIFVTSPKLLLIILFVCLPIPMALSLTSQNSKDLLWCDQILAVVQHSCRNFCSNIINKVLLICLSECLLSAVSHF